MEALVQGICVDLSVRAYIFLGNAKENNSINQSVTHFRAWQHILPRINYFQETAMHNDKENGYYLAPCFYLCLL